MNKRYAKNSSKKVSTTNKYNVNSENLICSGTVKKKEKNMIGIAKRLNTIIFIRKQLYQIISSEQHEFICDGPHRNQYKQGIMKNTRNANFYSLRELKR